MAADPRKLKPGELCRLLNSTPAGAVLTDARLRRHRERAGTRIGDGKTIDLLRYAAWLAGEGRAAPKPANVSPETPAAAAASTLVDAYDRKKVREANRNASMAAAKAEVGEIPPCANPQRREEAEKSFAAWCRTYLPHWFPLDNSPDQDEVDVDLDRTLRNGGRCPRAMPRGDGKSTRGKAAVLMGALAGLQSYALLVGATLKLGQKLVGHLRRELLTNDRLHEDYPEVCVPVRKIGLVVNRCGGQTHRGEPTFIELGKEYLVLPTIPGSKASGAIIACSGLEGAIRGANVNGRRPTFVFIDDPQTKKSAKSKTQIETRLGLIKTDVVGLAGPGVTMAVFAAVTVIYPGDVADQLLDRELNPDWRGKRYKLLYDFPTDMELWKEYGRLRRKLLLADVDDDELHRQLNAFYAAHREKMDAGARVGWAARKEPWQLSAVQFAVEIFITDPVYFWAECQNEPKHDEGKALVVLDAKLLRFRVDGLKRFTLPQATTHLVGHTDVQHKSLWWGVLACNDEIGGSFMYGAYPKQSLPYFTKRDVDPDLLQKYPGATTEGAVEQGLIDLFRRLRLGPWIRADGLATALELMLVDNSDGTMSDVVEKVCRLPEFLGWAIPATGKGIGPDKAPMALWKINEERGERGGFHWVTKPNMKKAVTQATVDANYWKTYAAGALTCPPTNRNAIVFSGQESTDHRLPADHFCAEVGKPITSDADRRTVTVWNLHPNRDNEHFDNLYNCCAAASMRGCTVNGMGDALKKRRRVKLSDLQKQRRAQGGEP